MTYQELYDAICQYVEAGDTDFLANIPNFVRNTEQLIFNTVQLPAGRGNVTSTVTAGLQYLTTPSDFLSSYSLAVIDSGGIYRYLIDKDVNYLREAFPRSGDTGVPTHYALFDEDSFILAPTPDQNYEVELHYYRYPESIVDVGTSWLGEHFDTALLYGSLYEANMFIKGEEDMSKTYKQRFDEALGRLKVLGDGKKRRDAYRSGQSRVPVM